MHTPDEKQQREDFWLEIGPPSAYFGMDACGTARENGDASPDGKRLGFSGAEPPAGDPEPEAPDDVPPGEHRAKK